VIACLCGKRPTNNPVRDVDFEMMVAIQTGKSLPARQFESGTGNNMYFLPSFAAWTLLRENDIVLPWVFLAASHDCCRFVELPNECCFSQFGFPLSVSNPTNVGSIDA
jgi:hypothetical protein